LVGRPFVDLLFEEDRPLQVEEFRRRARGESGQYERRVRCKDGSGKWLIFSAKARMEAGVFTGSFAMITDITERKRTEKEIGKQLEELRRWQKVTIDREGRVAELKIEVNELAARLGEKPKYGKTDGGG
jgi:hypothetical protein